MVRHGVHIILNLSGCPLHALERADALQNILAGAAAEAKLKVVGQAYHQFEPAGATGVLLLSQSHINAHTWPENGTALVDIFSCDPAKAEKAAEALVRGFGAAQVERHVLDR